MFQCKTYLNTCLVLNRHASTFIGISCYVQRFSLLWIGKEKKQYTLILNAMILI